MNRLEPQNQSLQLEFEFGPDIEEKDSGQIEFLFAEDIHQPSCSHRGLDLRWPIPPEEVGRSPKTKRV